MRLRATSGINVAILLIKQHRSTMQDAFRLLSSYLKRLFIEQLFTGVKVDSMMMLSSWITSPVCTRSTLYIWYNVCTIWIHVWTWRFWFGFVTMWVWGLHGTILSITANTEMYETQINRIKNQLIHADRVSADVYSSLALSYQALSHVLRMWLTALAWYGCSIDTSLDLF